MTRIIIISFFALLVAGCAKDAGFTPELAINQRVVNLNAVSDTARMLVFSSGNWTLENRDNASWINILQGSGNGQSYALVSAPDNSAGMPRATVLVVRSGALTDTIRFGQRGIVSKIAITAASLAVPFAAGTTRTLIDTNLPLDMMNVSNTDWISALQVSGQDLQFSYSANTTTAARRGVIYLRYQDALGTTTQDSLVVNQAKP